MTNLLNYSISTNYGVRRTYQVGGKTYNDVHDGVDFELPQGTPVTLPPGGEFDGKVTYAGLDQYNGAYVDIKANSDGGIARFLHLSKIDVFVGQQVTSNQRIGLSGGASKVWGSGLSTGPHLHFGLLMNNRAVDPLPWLKKAYNSTPPVPVPNPEFKKIYPDVGSGIWALCAKAGYPVINPDQSNAEPTNSICYNRIQELNGTKSMVAGREYTVDFDPAKWFNSKNINVPVQVITPPMPTITIEEPKLAPEPDLESLLKISELETKVKKLENDKVERMKADQLENDLNTNDLKKESFTFLKAFKGVETVGGVLATIILVAGFAVAKIDLLEGVLSPTQIAQTTTILSLTLVVCKTGYSIFKQIFNK